jgi:hypothetical protein
MANNVKNKLKSDILVYSLIMDRIESITQPYVEYLKNPYVVGVVGILAFVYGSKIAPKLQPPYAQWFDNPIFKVLFIFLILAVHQVSPTIAIVLTLALIISLQTLSRYKIFTMANEVSQITAQPQAPVLATHLNVPGMEEKSQFNQELSESMQNDKLNKSKISESYQDPVLMKQTIDELEKTNLQLQLTNKQLQQASQYLPQGVAKVPVAKVPVAKVPGTMIRAPVTVQPAGAKIPIPMSRVPVGAPFATSVKPATVPMSGVPIKGTITQGGESRPIDIKMTVVNSEQFTSRKCPIKCLHPRNRPTMETTALARRVEDPDDPTHPGRHLTEWGYKNPAIYELNPPFVRRYAPDHYNNPQSCLKNKTQMTKIETGHEPRYAGRYSAFHGYELPTELPPTLAPIPEDLEVLSLNPDVPRLNPDIENNMMLPLASGRTLPMQFFNDSVLPRNDNMNMEVSAQLVATNHMGAQGLNYQAGYLDANEMPMTPNY